MTSDLEQVVVVNESSDADRAGPIYLFKNVEDAENYLEPIDVVNGEYFAYLLGGRELKLSVVGNKVRIDLANEGTDHSQRIRTLLEASGAAVLTARKRRGMAKNDIPLSTISISDLIALVGFSA